MNELFKSWLEVFCVKSLVTHIAKRNVLEVRLMMRVWRQCHVQQFPTLINLRWYTHGFSQLSHATKKLFTSRPKQKSYRHCRNDCQNAFLLMKISDFIQIVCVLNGAYGKKSSLFSVTDLHLASDKSLPKTVLTKIRDVTWHQKVTMS